jgi:hypothetical protein
MRGRSPDTGLETAQRQPYNCCGVRGAQGIEISKHENDKFTHENTGVNAISETNGGKSARSYILVEKMGAVNSY